MDGYVSFLVDTGADRTTLMQADGLRLSLDYSRLWNATQALGVGGLATIFSEPASLIFSEPRTSVYVYSLDVDILQPKPINENTPSLLGRDILNRWRMSYNAANKRLFFKVLSADLTVPIEARPRADR